MRPLLIQMLLPRPSRSAATTTDPVNDETCPDAHAVHPAPDGHAVTQELHDLQRSLIQ